MHVYKDTYEYSFLFCFCTHFSFQIMFTILRKWMLCTWCQAHPTWKWGSMSSRMSSSKYYYIGPVYCEDHKLCGMHWLDDQTAISDQPNFCYIVNLACLPYLIFNNITILYHTITTIDIRGLFETQSGIQNRAFYGNNANGFQPLTIFTKSSTLDVWLGSECASGLKHACSLHKDFCSNFIEVIFEKLYYFLF